jgi:hypothetical protein
MTDVAPFSRWEIDDVIEAIHAGGVPIENVAAATWPPDAPQPRTHRQAVTFRGPGVTDPHLLLVFDDPDGLSAWHAWLARYWKARPYLASKDNVLLLVSRDLSPEQAEVYHRALDRLGLRSRFG